MREEGRRKVQKRGEIAGSYTVLGSCPRAQVQEHSVAWCKHIRGEP